MYSIEQYRAHIYEQKSIIDALRPLSDAQLRNMREWFRVGFIHHTNAIEGNTLSLQEVKMVVEEGITIGGKTVRELQETINHGRIMDVVGDFFDGKRCVIDSEFICRIHRLLVEGLVDSGDAGVWRTIPIRVSGSEDEFPSPDEVSGLMDDFVAQYGTISTLDKVASLHYDFVKIHPFVDGNGRIARFLMNVALVSLGYFPVVISRVVRQEYIGSLQGNNKEKWTQFFYWQLYENMKDYVRFLQG